MANANRRISQENRRRKEADATIRAEVAERDARILSQAKQYTDDQIAAMRRELGAPSITDAEVISIIHKRRTA